ncbi:MAG: hypothetical protein J7K68_03610 [Candidatus Diapherotrites archaeon]|nr:hypothetical protein [Candidatus Diapherotrites archaeon]
MEEQKERVTITLPTSLLNTVDSLVDGKEIRNRSHAIESLILKALRATPVDTAFILAGGVSPKDPYGARPPQAMIKVKGKPVVEYTLNWLKDHGITHVIFGVGAKNTSLQEYFGDGTNIGLSIEYSLEKKPLGTAGCLSPVKDKLTKTFVVVYGDILTRFNLTDMIKFHKKRNASITIALKSVEDPSYYGVAELEGYNIVGFVEKPKQDEVKTHMINAGVYVIEPHVLEDVSPPCSMELELIPKLIEQRKVAGYPISGPWIDIGKPGAVEIAEKIV